MNADLSDYEGRCWKKRDIRMIKSKIRMTATAQCNYKKSINSIIYLTCKLTRRTQNLHLDAYIDR